MTRRSPWLIAACLIAAAVLLPLEAQAQYRRGPRVAVGASVVVGSPYYYRPYLYDPWSAWYPYYWYPSPYYYGGYYDTGASLRLQVTPREAEVFVDGYYAGVVNDFDGTFQRLNLEPGEHELQLFLPGYRAISQRIYLQPRSTFRVKHAMEPLAPGDLPPIRPNGGPRPQRISPGPGPQGQGQAAPRGTAPRANTSPDAAYGTLAIRVQPGDAEVMIDGERWEGTSGDERLIVQLAPGSHRVDVRKDGYRAFSTDVNIQPGETAPLNVSLAKPR